jgi:release factor glutamine methyltransferase
MTVREALREGAAALAGTETPFLDASLLLGATLRVDSSRLLASSPDPVPEGELARYRESLSRRASGLPVAYILGYKEFWGRRFAVDPRVLIPRPDTETLVEAALKLGDIIFRERAQRVEASPEARLRVQHEPALRVHEACAGSGCVAISVAAERPGWEVSASDLSGGALEVASANAESILGPGRGASRPGGALALFESDLLSSVLPRASLDLVLANPPYVTSAETDELLSRGWSEPRMALDGGGDGLDLLRRLAGEAFEALAGGGGLLVEADGAQAEAVAELFRSSRFIGVETICDLAGIGRVTSGRKPWTT